MAPFQLIPEEGGEALRLPVCGAPLRNGALLMEKGAAVRAGVQPAGCPAQLGVCALQAGGALRLQQRVFLTGAPQVLRQVLHVHLQDLHGLEQLRRQLELLPEFGF